MKHETVKDIKDYAILRMLLQCSEYDLREWERLGEGNKAIIKHLAEVDEEFKAAGCWEAVKRARALLKRKNRTASQIINERVQFFRKEQADILERMQAAEEAVLSLPDILQETIWYIYIEGWEPARVANMMNCKLSVIERRRQEGLKALRDSSGK